MRLDSTKSEGHRAMRLVQESRLVSRPGFADVLSALLSASSRWTCRSLVSSPGSSIAHWSSSGHAKKLPLRHAVALEDGPFLGFDGQPWTGLDGQTQTPCQQQQFKSGSTLALKHSECQIW